MGPQLPIPTALSIRQPPADHGPDAGDRLSRPLHVSGQESRLLEKDSSHWRGHIDSAGKVSGFSLHAGVATRANERKKLERLSEGGPAVTSVGQPSRRDDLHPGA